MTKKNIPNEKPTSNAAEAVPFDMSVEELKRRMDGGEKLFLLDVREPFEYRYASIGGQLIPLGELPERMGELDKTQEIAVLCHHGNRSARAVQYLRDRGFHRARNVTGGIEAWSVRIDRTVPRY